MPHQTHNLLFDESPIPALPVPGSNKSSHPHIFPHKVVGIIAEYNPFHCGHAFHIREAKRICGADFCIVAMSGDFVQRGAPAIFDKYIRTAMALLSGADLVLELPPHFAVSSAEDFAACGVALLDRLGVVSHLCFGSECGEISALTDIARILAWEPDELSEMLRYYTASGYSYPKAREMALTRWLSLSPSSHSPAELLSSPNNILGIEYCKALIRRGSSMIPATIPRTGAGYHEKALSSTFSSATAIRSIIYEAYQAHTRLTPDIFPSGDLCPVPPACRELFQSAVPLAANDFSSLLSYRLLELRRQGIGLETFADVSPELAARIQKQLLSFSSFEERAVSVKTRQYTYTRVSRCLTHILLHITAEDILDRKAADYISSIRVLGFRREAASLLGAVKRGSDLPLITKTADAPHILSPQALSRFLQDLFCSHVYQSVWEQKSRIRPDNEYTKSVIIV